MNRCRRCNREISDPNAIYGWRCAEILGVSETLSEMGEDVFEKFMDGVIKAQSLLGEDNAEFSERQRKSLYSAYAKMSLWDGIDDKKVKEAKKERYSIFGSRKTKTKSFADELNEYKDYIESSGIASRISKTPEKKRRNDLDSSSNLLTAASLIPGLDTFTNIASIPVDLARGDYVSAGLSALGVIPFVGEFADLAKYADKGIDAAKMMSRSSKGQKLLNKVSNSKLKNTIKEMYRPGAKVGDGGLADAIRQEIKTGQLVGGKSHIQKGTERLKNLENILERETLTKQDIKIIEDLINDLKNALGGK